MENFAGVHMDGPDYHRRQAEILTRIAKTVSNVEAAAALSELAAMHRAFAERARSRAERIDPLQERPTALAEPIDPGDSFDRA